MQYNIMNIIYSNLRDRMQQNIKNTTNYELHNYEISSNLFLFPLH
jgi:hypothetical protein